MKISCYTILSNSPLGTVSKKNINPIHFGTKTHFSTRGVLKAKDMTLKQKQNWLKASYFQLQRRGERDTVSYTANFPVQYIFSFSTSVVLMTTGCSNATRRFWVSLLPWGRVFLNCWMEPACDGTAPCSVRRLWKGAEETLGQGTLWNDSLPGCDGSKDQWRLQDWGLSGSLERVPMENCEEISIINRKAQDREMKAEYRNWKNIFWIQEWFYKKTHEAIWKDVLTKCILCLNS